MSTLWICLLALAMVGGGPSSLGAQVARAAVGSLVGVAGGAMITLSAVVARAQIQEVYLESMGDLIDWQSVPMILTPAVGIAFGLAGKEPLRGSIIGSTSGMLAGAAIGAGIGWATSTQAEAPWAGGVIGAGLGMTVGGLTLGIRNWLKTADEEAADEIAPVRIGFTVPL